MIETKITPRNGADVEGFRQEVAAGWRGDARARPLDCTGRRFLVRDERLEAFSRLAARFGLAVEREGP